VELWERFGVAISRAVGASALGSHADFNNSAGTTTQQVPLGCAETEAPESEVPDIRIPWEQDASATVGITSSASTSAIATDLER